MATYKFEQFKVTIQNPTVDVVRVYDDFNGQCEVDIVLSLGNVNNKVASFGVRLECFTYVNEWTKQDIDTWVASELVKHEV